MRTTPLDQAKRLARHTEELVHRSLATLGATQSQRRIAADAQDYWHQPAA